MTPGKKQAFEPTGLIPRSIVRTFERFYKQLLPRTKYSAIREYRISRYQVLVSIRCLCTLLVLPLVTRIIAAGLIFPQIQYFWDVTYQDSHVFSEIDQFSQVIFFDSLLDQDFLSTTQSVESSFESRIHEVPISTLTMQSATTFDTGEGSSSVPVWNNFYPESSKGDDLTQQLPSITSKNMSFCGEARLMKQTGIVDEPHRTSTLCVSAASGESTRSVLRAPRLKVAVSNDVHARVVGAGSANQPPPKESTFKHFFLTNTQIQNKSLQDQALQEKIFELAQSSHSHALQSLTNVFADFLSIIVLIFLLITLKPEITILKSFLVEVIYNLSDTTKSFLLILMTDLLVGFHSPRGWETMFSLILHHFGLPENQDFVFLFVATLPVILDTVFKYWIFRHLNKISPSTVATYHNMIE